MKYIPLLMVFALCLVIPTIPIEGSTPSGDESYLYDRINVLREEAGLNPLRINGLLIEVARSHSQEMMKFDFFDHYSHVDGSNPYDRVERSGYYDEYNGIRFVSENIGLTWPGVNVDAAMKAWMGSQDHLENILNSYSNEVGVGIAVGEYKGKEETALYTAIFTLRDDVPDNIITTGTISSSTETSNLPTSTFTSSSSTRFHTTSIENMTHTSVESTTSSTNTHTTSQITSIMTMTSTTVLGGATINYQDSGMTFQIISNSKISNIVYDPNEKVMNFTVNGVGGTKGFCNASIPKALIEGSPIVFLDGDPIEVKLKEDTTSYYISFTYNHITHHVMIGGSNTIPDLPHTLIALILVISISLLITRPRVASTSRE